jgi:hypothetical protein
MKVKLAWVVRDKNYYGTTSYGEWYLTLEEPSNYGNERKKIVYFEVENNDD